MALLFQRIQRAFLVIPVSQGRSLFALNWNGRDFKIRQGKAQNKGGGVLGSRLNSSLVVMLGLKSRPAGLGRQLV